jgi:benzil reductase ((S)-benzoin forming)
MTAHQTLVWITGATQGIGEALARNVPYESARVINISRRQHPTLETIRADLTDPTSWDRVVEHIGNTLMDFRGDRAIFINNANFGGQTSFAGEGDASNQRKQVYANVAAPLIFGDAFIRAHDDRYEGGLVFVSSATARHAMEGLAVYGAAKASMEQWVRAVRAERKRRGKGPWVIAIRPGFVATESTLKQHSRPPDPEEYPGAAAVREAIASGRYLTPDQSASEIWSLLPPRPEGRNVLFVGEFVADAAADVTSKSEK